VLTDAYVDALVTEMLWLADILEILIRIEASSDSLVT